MGSYFSKAESPQPKLFLPISVGRLDLKHRVVLAPLTRHKSEAGSHIPHVPLVKEYYSQRASAPGTLLISEATFIARKAGVYKNVPGVWSDEQAKAWKEITDAVHAQGSFIYCQLWALGRAADYDALRDEDPSLPYVGASDIPLTGRKETPRPLTVEEIAEYTRLYADAASTAVHKAGFDGVEIHGANGYLIDQFLQDVSNDRTDEYGGSVENRSRFALEVIDAVSKAVGPDRTAIRLSPWSLFQDMRMKDPIPTFSHLVTEIKERQPTLAYIHVVEPRITGSDDREPSKEESIDFLRDIWAPRPYISAGGYKRETAIAHSTAHNDLVAFGRFFISNPDIVRRLREDIPLTKYDRSTFYIPGDWSGKGYTDYPFAP